MRVLLGLITSLALSSIAVSGDQLVPRDTRELLQLKRLLADDVAELKRHRLGMEHAAGERAARRMEVRLETLRTYWKLNRTSDDDPFFRRALKALRDTVRASVRMNMSILAESERSLVRSCTECHHHYQVVTSFR